MPNYMFLMKNQNKVHDVQVRLQWQDANRISFKNNKNGYLFREEKLTIYFRKVLFLLMFGREI